MVALRTFVYDVMPLLRVEWITEAEHQAALNMVLTSGRKELSLVDCMSFQTMRSAGVSKAFCFDTHFRQQGFETL
jgi:predicted nucleic acid-binding protein